MYNLLSHLIFRRHIGMRINYITICFIMIFLLILLFFFIQLSGKTFVLIGSSFPNMLVRTCGFDNESRMLRDRIVLGLTDKNVQKKLLEPENHTCENAVLNIVQASEVSKIRASNMQQRESFNSIDVVHGMHADPNSSTICELLETI